MSDIPLNPQSPDTQNLSENRRWQPLGAVDRRVAGVLAEKAKTTPDIYPMSLNAICAGSNQKSNRAPLMQLEPVDVEESLGRLRALGAVGLVEGYGRVAKYRHYLYEWLGVDKVELAVMTELLLRGDQTVGELRSRAIRMEPISDLNALRPILDSLECKGLVISLTPKGRGHVVTHALYKPRELDALRAEYSGARPTASTDETSQFESRLPAATSACASVASNPRDTAVEALRHELATLRDQVTELRQVVEEVRSDQLRLSHELRGLKDALGD